MRGLDGRSGELFSYVDLERRVRPDHPLRPIREMTSLALARLSDEFAGLYSGMGRPSIAPEMLLRAMLLQAFYSIRSERQLLERLGFDLLFRWFVGLGVDGEADQETIQWIVSPPNVWDHSTFSKTRDRLLAGDIAGRFLSALLSEPRVKRLLSSEHFSVDGTLIQAWASMKSFRPKQDQTEDDDGKGSGGGFGGGFGGGRNEPADFRGEKRSNGRHWSAIGPSDNGDHASTTDPDAMLYRKGPGMGSRLCFIGHGLMENRSGLIVDARLTRVSGHAERLAALEMIGPWADRPRAVTLGADRGYDAADFRRGASHAERPPACGAEHQPAPIGDRPAHDRRTTRHPGYAASQRARKRIPESASRRRSAG